jgi:hypothetical protein
MGNLFRIDRFQFIGESYIPTSVDNQQNGRTGIRIFELYQNYPNPFNPITHITYSVHTSGYITLKVYNLIGQEVKTIFEDVRQPGDYTVTFDGKGLSSGVYLYQLRSENFVETKKLLLLK